MLVAMADQVGQLRKLLTQQIESFAPSPGFTSSNRKELLEYTLNGTPITSELSNKLMGMATCLGFYEIMQTAEQLQELQKEEAVLA